ncbi:MAG: FHA domain-containing protein [Anaerolineae bacterium]
MIDKPDKEDQTRAIPAELLDQLAEEDQHIITDSISDDDSQRDETSAEPVVHLGDDETHATVRMDYMNDDDGLLHIGTVRFRGNLVLTDTETSKIYRISNEDLEEVILGRVNLETGFRPQVDFTEDDGKERGVSRRHATINQHGDLIFVTDHNSLNGTFLNGQRLVPEQARVMRDSDSLRIGHITLLVSFERIPAESS